MLNMRVKTKIVTAAIGIIAITMIVSSAIVSYIIYGQNRDQSNQILQQSATIVRDDMAAIGKNLMSNTRQAAVSNDIGTNMSFAASMSYEEGESMGLVSTFQNMVQGAYSISLSGNIWKTAIYNQKNKLFGFVVIENDQRVIGFPRPNDFLAASFKKGQEINAESWKPMANFSEFAMTWAGEVPKKERLEFKQIGDSISLVATVPIHSTGIDEKTGQEVLIQVGIVVTNYRLDSGFTKRLSKITGNQIGIIKPDNVIIGDLSGYPGLQTDAFKDRPADWDLKSQPITLNTTTR